MRFSDAINSVGETINILKEQNNALSLQVQVLREALEKCYEALPCELDYIANEALSTTPSQDDWIRKSELKEVAFVVAQDDGEITSEVISEFLKIGTKLYRIKETTK